MPSEENHGRMVLTERGRKTGLTLGTSSQGGGSQAAKDSFVVIGEFGMSLLSSNECFL